MYVANLIFLFDLYTKKSKEKISVQYLNMGFQSANVTLNRKRSTVIFVYRGSSVMFSKLYLTQFSLLTINSRDYLWRRLTFADVLECLDLGRKNGLQGWLLNFSNARLI
jgi:hypothetical protein